MVSRTQKDIVESFKHLITKKHFEDITIQMIADEAGVSRATFYRYFRDKYDIMNYNYQSILDKCMKENQTQTFQELFYAMTTAGTDALRPMIRLFESSGVNSFQNFIYNYSFKTLENIVLKACNEQKLTDKQIFQYRFFCRGVAHMYEEWLRGVHNMSAEEVTNYLCELLPSELQTLHF